MHSRTCHSDSICQISYIYRLIKNLTAIYVSVRTTSPCGHQQYSCKHFSHTFLSARKDVARIQSVFLTVIIASICTWKIHCDVGVLVYADLYLLCMCIKDYQFLLYSFDADCQSLC